jgi:hypothetical protein
VAIVNNLISVCWLIENQESGVEPVIYLQRPDVDFDVRVIVFDNPFEAKNHIRHFNAEIPIMVIGTKTMREFKKAG